ncbi:MAG: hypothetical protein ACLP9L_25415 [Thermoguttaceae bacterium]
MSSEGISLRVIDVLNEHGIPYMVVGSLSTNFHSVPRATKDADIVVQSSLSEAARSIAGQCPELRLDPQFGFESVTATKKIILRADAEEFIVELFGLSDDEHDQERFRRRKLVDWDGHPTWIASAEDALITKLRWAHVAGRRKDLVDASTLIASIGETIDWRYVESWCDRHGSRKLLEQIREELRERPEE